jgi:hypothetical protein
MVLRSLQKVPPDWGAWMVTLPVYLVTCLESYMYTAIFSSQLYIAVQSVWGKQQK